MNAEKRAEKINFNFFHDYLLNNSIHEQKIKSISQKHMILCA